MKRLTIKKPNGAALEMNDTYPNENAAREDLMNRFRVAIDRLAAYEDAGLDPEEIIGLCSMAERAKMANLLRLEEYQALGTIDHLRELTKAEKDERMVLLPVTLGQEVWLCNRAFDGEIIPATVISIELNYYTPDNPIWVRIEYRSERIGKHEYHSRWDLMNGKTVFLTREEAEAALKKREADNEAS